MSAPEQEHEAESFYDLDSSRWLKAEHLQGKKVTLTIKQVKYVDTTDDDGKPKRETIIYFNGTDRHLGCNVTNRQCIRGMFGIKIKADWVGKKVVLFPTVTERKVYSKEDGETKLRPCIRVWGSPDIEADIKVIVNLHRKKPFSMVMNATGTKKPATPPDQEPPQDREREPGEGE